MTFHAFVVRNLIRRPLRAALAALGIALAVGSFITLLSISRGNAHAWQHTFASQGTDLMVSRKGGVELMTTSIEETTAEKVARVPGAAAVAGELLDLVALDSGQNVVVSGRPPGSFLWTSLRMAEGTLPQPGSETGVALGQSMADALGVHVGDHLTVDGRQLIVTGVVRAGGALTGHMLFMPLPAMQDLMHRSGVVTILNVRLAPPADRARTDAFVRAASQAFPGLTFTPSESLENENPVLKAANALAWAVSAIALIIGLFGIINTLLMSVTERVRELGILTAVGWSPSRVIALVVAEGVVLAWTGSVIGVAGGWVALRTLEASPRIAGLLETQMTARLAVEVVVVTLLLGCVGGLYPAWRVTRLSPVEALKHE